MENQEKHPKGKKFTSEYGIANYRADQPDTTTWHDIFDKRATGEIENDRYLKQVENEYRLQELNAQKQQIFKYMKHKKEIYGDSSDEIDEEVSGFSELDEEEKQFMEHLKQERKEQQLIEAGRQRYYQIIDIDAKSYKQAVQTDYWCIIFAQCQTQQFSIKIDAFLNMVNKQYPTIKICRIDYKQASKDFKPEDMPALFIYSKGELIYQFVGKYQFGGINIKYEDFLQLLASKGIIQYEKPESSQSQ